MNEIEAMDEKLEIINAGDPVDTCYGLNVIELEPKHMAAIIMGKQLYATINCAEYAIIIKRKEQY